MTRLAHRISEGAEPLAVARAHLAEAGWAPEQHAARDR